MTAIDLYLKRVAKRLWMRKRARISVMAELREHLESLEEQRTVAFGNAHDVEQVFGRPGVLAAQLNRSIRWQDARAPWWFFALFPLGIAAFLMVFLLGKWLLVPHLANHRDIVHLLALATQLAFPSLTLLVIFTGLRRGVRPLVIMLALMVPRLLMSMLSGCLMVEVLRHTLQVPILPYLCCSCGDLLAGGAEILLLITLAELCKSRAFGHLIGLSVLALLACRVLDDGLNAALLSRQFSWSSIGSSIMVLAIMALATAFVARSTRALRPT